MKSFYLHKQFRELSVGWKYWLNPTLWLLITLTAIKDLTKLKKSGAEFRALVLLRSESCTSNRSGGKLFIVPKNDVTSYFQKKKKLYILLSVPNSVVNQNEKWVDYTK